MPRKVLLAALGALLIGSVSVAADATIALFLTREELCARSTLVVRVTVGKAATSASADGAALVTRTPILIKECLKAPIGSSEEGLCPAHLVVQQLGGHFKDKTQKVLGDGVLRAGEDAIVFLKIGEDGTAYLTALALSVYHVDSAGLAHRELDGLSFMQRRSGKIEPADIPAEPALKAEELAADIARIAKATR